MSQWKLKHMSRSRLSVLSAGTLLAVGLVLARPTQAALGDIEQGPQLIGRDDDDEANESVQADAIANQSLNRTDVMDGGSGNDVMFGLNGSDVMNGGSSADIVTSIESLLTDIGART